MPPWPRSVIDLSAGTAETKRRLPVVGDLTCKVPDSVSVPIVAVMVTAVSAVCAQPLSTKVASAVPSGRVVALSVIVALPAAQELLNPTSTGPPVYGWPPCRTCTLMPAVP